MVTVDYGATAEELLELYREYGWWDDREESDVRRALRSTDEVVLLRTGSEAGSGEPVAAARILTDYVYYAMVYDVIVAADRRGTGVGRELMTAVREHPRLREVSPSLLAREGLVPFYESCGFDAADEAVDHPDGEPEPLVWMVHGRE
ncbi:GNAT family N-acetyltransferase [Haladaptatus salinisoli]|uniref:GNAT family N-acetyltransferase n=1 Tax=Haladaptatus salinisoli TaxID=2884876 RepID=UPI001D0A1E11|nr:GNAT family N-acetyltransferase [Haladaptatus salinisoli]